MNLFDEILTKPIFNVLAFIYNFVGDFGVSIIIVTVMIRLLLWPVMRRQLHQSKLMRELQPELRKIRRQTKDKMAQSTMMMALYKERGVKPAASIVANLIQLPILLAVYSVVRIITHFNTHVDAANYIYPALRHFGRIPELLTANPHVTLFGVIDLDKAAVVYAPALIIALLAALFQYIQTKQILPRDEDTRGIRKILKDAADGEKIDQSEINAAAGRKMALMSPLITLMISMPFPSAVVLYYAASSAFAVLQQHIILNNSQSELKAISQERLKQAKPAIVRRKQLAEEAETKPTNVKTVIRRKTK